MAPRHRPETLSLVLLAAASTALGRRPTGETVRTASLGDITEITESLKNISDVIRGIHTFLSGITLISETIGFATIFLFIAVLLLSAGYSALGMPRGKASFISSLITADIIWGAWVVSAQAPLSGYLASMIRANLIVLCPLIVAAVAFRAAPALAEKAGALVAAVLRRERRMDRRDAAVLCEECQARSARLCRTLTQDILAADGTGNAVKISPETMKNAHELGETLRKIDTAGS